MAQARGHIEPDESSATSPNAPRRRFFQRQKQGDGVVVAPRQMLGPPAEIVEPLVVELAVVGLPQGVERLCEVGTCVQRGISEVRRARRRFLYGRWRN